MLSDLLHGVLDLVFAATCVACGGAIPSRAKQRFVCSACWTRTRPIPYPRCERCWTPLPEAQGGSVPACRLCPTLRPALRAIRSPFVLGGPVRPMVHALKYRGWYGMARPLAERMASVTWPREVEAEVGVVVPVPLSASRQRERGYNQAALLANEVARAKGWICEQNALERARSSGSQTSLHPTERRANVAGAFRARAGAADRLALQHVLIVDDVWTTGATSLACGEAVLAAGARAFSVLTFARALPELERLERRAELAGITAIP